MRGTGTTPRHLVERSRPSRRLSVATVLAMCAGLLVGATALEPARAAQAQGADAAAWQVGWKWTYATQFKYSSPDATATVNETVTATVDSLTLYAGQPAYRLTLSGTVNNGSGSASGQNLTIEGGNVSGHRFVRRSDLALLEERQIQHIEGCAGPFCAVGVEADVDITLTPSPSWKQHVFPLSSGDSWQVNETIDYDGSFSYDAGNIGGSGSDTLEGSIPFAATATVVNQTISAAGGSVATQFVDASSGPSVAQHWWSAAHRNDAKDYLRLPLDDATLEITRTLSSASMPAPANTITENLSDSLTCAGDAVTVSGALSSAASGVPVAVALDRSQAGLGVSTVNTTTGANGAYSATITAPAQSDGMQKNGSRANWGVLVSAPSAGAYQVRTLVVNHQNCSSIAYTGATSGAYQGTAAVSAKLTDEGGQALAAGKTVTFSLTGGGSVNATTNGNGVATATLPIAGSPRSATLTTSYAGSAALQAAQVSVPFTVTVAPSATSVTPSASTVVIGSSVTFTAAVTPAGVSGGTVQFLVDDAEFGSAVPLAANDTATSASLATGPIGLGTHTVKAVYSGDTNFASSTSPAQSFTVREPLLASTTTQDAAPSSSVFGQPVTLSAHVDGAGAADPEGTVTFRDGATVLGEAPLDGNGDASIGVGTLAVGTHEVTATYSGDDVHDPSTSAPDTVTVAKADVDVNLASADVTTVSGEAVSLSATIAAEAPGAGVPTGTAQLLVDGVEVGDPATVVGGVVTFDPVTTLGAGDHTVAVAYNGDESFRTGTGSLTQHVAKAATGTVVAVSPSPSNEEQPVVITATVAAEAPGSGSPTGTVVFTSNGNVVGAAPLDGNQASIEVDTLAVGAHSVVASYPGDANFLAGESAPVAHAVVEGAAIVETATSLVSSENPSTYGELITFTATVSAADESDPVGAVRFSVDGADFGDPVPVDGDGVAVSATLASPEPGDHTVIAAFEPQAGFAASGGVLTQTVSSAGVALELESSDADSDYSQPLTFTATVASTQLGTGTPGGYVQFGIDGQPFGDAVELVDGVATSPSVADMAPGTHTVTALYSGDRFFVPASTQLTQGVARIGTTTALAASTTSPTYGQAVTLTATVTPAQTAHGAPTGTVTFRDGSTELGTVPVTADGSTARAQLVVPAFGAGSHTLTAEYAGGDLFDPSTSPPVVVTVAKRATTLDADAALVRVNPLLGINLGVMRATLTTSAGPLAGQPVVFSVGGSPACTVNTDANGLATCNTTAVQLLVMTLGGGFTATYAGDANHLGSTDTGTLVK